MATFLDSRDAVLRDELVLGEALQEARENMWAFSMDQGQASRTSQGDVVQFLDAIVERREGQLLARCGHARPLVFYCWFDRQAAQLRFSLSSYPPHALPFAGPVVLVPDLATVVVNFLASPDHDGIPWAGLDDVDSASSIREDPERGRQPLEVWAVRIPRTGPGGGADGTVASMDKG